MFMAASVFPIMPTTLVTLPCKHLMADVLGAAYLLSSESCSVKESTLGQRDFWRALKDNVVCDH